MQRSVCAEEEKEPRRGDFGDLVDECGRRWLPLPALDVLCGETWGAVPFVERSDARNTNPTNLFGLGSAYRLASGTRKGQNLM